MAFIFSLAGILTRKASLRSYVAGAVSASVGICWLLWQYRTVVPNTIRAKAVGYIITRHQTATELGVGRRIVVVTLVVCVGLLMDRWSHFLRASNLLFLSGLVLIAAYIWRRTFIFPWYGPLVIECVVLGLSLGAIFIGPVWSRTAALVLLLLFLYPTGRVASYQVVAFLDDDPARDRPEIFNVRDIGYRAMGEAIAASCPQARMLSSEIGELGIAFPGEILDGFGLASPAAIKYHPMRVPDERSDGLFGAIPPGFVQETHPDVIISYDFLAESLIRHYDSSVYEHFVFPALPAPELAQYEFWRGKSIHLWLSRRGACRADQVVPKLRAAFAGD